MACIVLNVSRVVFFSITISNRNFIMFRQELTHQNITKLKEIYVNT